MGCVCVVSSARHDENRMDKNNGSLENKWTNWIRNFYLLSEWVNLCYCLHAVHYLLLHLRLFYFFFSFVRCCYCSSSPLLPFSFFFNCIRSTNVFFSSRFFVRCSCNLFRFYCVRFFFSLYIKFKQTLNALHESDFKAVFVWIWVSVCIQQKNCNRNC